MPNIIALTHIETEKYHNITEAYHKVNEAKSTDQIHTWMLQLKWSCPNVTDDEQLHGCADNKSTACGCQRLAVAAFWKLKKGHNYVNKKMEDYFPYWYGFPFWYWTTSLEFQVFIFGKTRDIRKCPSFRMTPRRRRQGNDYTSMFSSKTAQLKN